MISQIGLVVPVLISAFFRLNTQYTYCFMIQSIEIYNPGTYLLCGSENFCPSDST